MFLLLFSFATFSILFSTIKNGISPMPSNRYALRLAIEQMGSPKIVQDLGCGFGLSSYFLAKRLPNTQVIGVENSFFCFLVAKFISLFASNLKIKWDNFLKEGFEFEEVLYLYLCPRLMQQLLHRKEQLKNKTIISNTFAFDRIKGQTIELGDFFRSTLYIYHLDC
jgi:SAM-dependent methyltransferase